MPAMGSATISKPKPHRGRGWLLACVVYGFAAAPLAAQTTRDETADALAAATDAGAPGDGAVARPAETDPVATNEQLVAGTISQFGRKSLQAAEAYLDLAEAQRRAKRYEQAAESYLAAVEVYRSVDGPFTPLAIAPL